MNQQSFEEKNKARWEQLEKEIEALEKIRRDKDFVPKEFPKLYRQVCHDLALAKERMYSTLLINHLNRLVHRGHQHFYRTSTNSIYNIFRFLLYEFPCTIRQNALLVFLACLIFYFPTILIAVTVYFDPDFVFNILEPAQVNDFETMYSDSSRLGKVREADSNFLMFGYYIFNNISIAFRTLAWGVLFGIGSIYVLLFNGIYSGAVGGYLVQAGHGENFFSFIAAHSSFELTAIVFAGVAGMKLGFAIVAPGSLSRSLAFKNAAKEAVKITYGVFAMLLAAAFIEAFWSPTNFFGVQFKYITGMVLWTVVILFFIFSGRRYAIRPN